MKVMLNKKSSKRTPSGNKGYTTEKENLFKKSYMGQVHGVTQKESKREKFFSLLVKEWI